MKQFVFLTYGFRPPTPEIMAAWQAWFESLKGSIVTQGHLMNGREISDDGTRELPRGLDAITGFVIVRAQSLGEAEKMAQRNPYISSIRVYELATG